MIRSNAAKFVAEYTRSNSPTETFDAYLGKADGSTITAPDREPQNTLVWYHLGDGTEGLATLKAGCGVPYLESAGMANLPIRVGKAAKKENLPGYVVMGIAGQTGLYTANSNDINQSTLTVYVYPSFGAQPANMVNAGPETGTPAVPTFRALVAADIPNLDAGKITTGTLTVARGGTGASTLTGVLLGNGTSAVTAIAGTSGKFIRHNGTNWTADTIVAADLPNHSAALLTSGTVGLARGGTNADLSSTGPGFLKQSTSGAAVTVSTLAAGDIPNLDMSKITTGTLSVGQGGTGATTLTGILLGNGTSAVTAISGTSGKFIRHNGTNWVADTIAAVDLPNHSAGLLTSGSISLGAGSTISVGGNTGLPASTNVALFSGSSSGGLINAAIENYVTTANNNATSLDFILGSGFSPTARIMANLDNAGTAATSLRFLTYNSGLAERARIQADGSFGINTTSPVSMLHAVTKDANTTSIASVLTVGHNLSAGSGANNIGSSIAMQAQTSTTADTEIVSLEALLPTATHASRTGQFNLKIMDSASKRTAISFAANGSDIQFAIGSSTPQTRPTYSAPTGSVSRATFDPSTVTLNALAQIVAAMVTDNRTLGIYK